MKLFSLLRKDLLILLRERADMLVLFLMPLAFIIPISFALGAGDGYGVHRDNQMIPLPVVDYDQGFRSQALLTTIGESLKLETEYDINQVQSAGLLHEPDCTQTDPDFPTNNPACIEKVGRALLQKGSRSAVLVIPEGFTKGIEDGKKTQAILLYDPAGDSTRFQQIQGVLSGAAIRISLENQVKGGLNQLNDLVILAPADIRQPVQNQLSTPQPKSQNPAIRLEKTLPEQYTPAATPNTYQQTIPGYTVMFVFFIITSMSGSIRQERLQGTFRRQLGAPVSRAELLGGKLLASMIIGLVQVFILFGVGALVFKLDLGSDPLAFFVLTLALVAAATSLGLLAATTSLRGGGLAAPLIITALLGGCMFPLDLMPSFLRTVSYFVPHSWALTGYQNLLVRGLGLQEVFPQILVLLLFAALFFWIALRRFDFEKD
jgi:ABC-2 type transport system permease protein